MDSTYASTHNGDRARAGAAAGTPPEYLVNANERQYLGKLCWLLHDGGTLCLRATFDSFHPPLTLKAHLGQHHVRAVLSKIRDQKILNDKQWRTLYPTKKQDIANLTSDNFDARILSVLLQFICHLSPPYPHGWSALPLPQDTSVSADVVRLQMYLQQAGSLGGVRQEEYPVLWRQVVQVLLRLGGAEVRVKIARIDQETLNPEQQAHYIALVKNSWGSPDEGALGRLRKMGAVRFLGGGRGKGKRRPGDKAPEQEGISPEERVVLSRCHRQLCDVVMAEDIVDRLVQGHALSFADRQEILTPGRNLDRMQILVSKIMNTKVNTAFKVLMDNLKVKYPRVYESVHKVRLIVQKEGVSDVPDVTSFCQEGLDTHYRSLFSRVNPLPWSEVQSSIRDVYVPLDVATEDGQKLQLSAILPPVVTSGRGKRVLVEGESGSGKTYLAAMLTYQWASQRTYFNTPYAFLIYLDTRMIRGPLPKAIHSLCLPEGFKMGPDEFWGVLEEHARDTIFVIDGFDEDHSNEDLRKVILGEKLRHASVLLTSRPEARAAKWMNPDDRLYVLGLSNINIGRCLKSYAVIAQMTSEEYDRFHDVISNPAFEMQSQLAKPYVCLLIFGVYLATGTAGLSSLTTLTSLLQRYLVAMATHFIHKLGLRVGEAGGAGQEEKEGGGGEEGGGGGQEEEGRARTGQFSPELVAAIREAQSLAYHTLVSREKLLGEAQDLVPVINLLRAVVDNAQEELLLQAAESARNENGFIPGGGGGGKGGKRAVNGTAKTDDKDDNDDNDDDDDDDGDDDENDDNDEGKSSSNSSSKGTISSRGRAGDVRFQIGPRGKKPAPVVTALTNIQLLARVGLIYKLGVGSGVGGGGGGGEVRWAFTCSVAREFLAARHLADMPAEGVGQAVAEQKMLRHPRFAQTTSFLCALLQSDPDPALMTSLLQDLTLQATRHGRRINFKDDSSSTTSYAPTEDGDDTATESARGPAGSSYVTNFSHCLQALAECSPLHHQPPPPATTPTTTTTTTDDDGDSEADPDQLPPQPLPHPDPSTQLPKCLPRCVVVQRDGLIPVKILEGLALAVRSPVYHLSRLDIELMPFHVHQKPVLENLAQALAENATLQNLTILWHGLGLLISFLRAALSRAPALHALVLRDVGRQSSGDKKTVTASTWAGLQEVCSLLRNTRSFTLAECGSAPVVGQWVLHMPHTVLALHFPGCAFNSISCSDLGSKLETSESCVTLNLSHTCLASTDLSALFQNLKLNSSLQTLSLAGTHLDRSATASLAEYIRLNSSLRRLDLSRSHVTTEACHLLAAALKGNYYICTLDMTDATLSAEGREVLLATKEGEITWLGFEETYYS